MEKNLSISLADNDDIWPLSFITSGKFLRLLSLIPEAVVISDQQGNILQADSQAQQLFQYTHEEFLELRVEDLVPERFRRNHPSLRKKFFEHPKPRFIGNRKYDLYALCKDSSEFAMDASLFSLETDQGLVAINLIRDITKAKQLQQQIENKSVKLAKIANIDQLTKIANRRSFEQKLDDAIAQSKRHHTPLALLFVDLDKFKDINDQYGHHIGDEVLLAVSQRIQSILRKDDLTARLAGDEFVCIISNFQSKEILETICNRLIEALSKPIKTSDDNVVNLTVSIGLAFFDKQHDTEKTLVQHADQAMYQAKKNGGNQFSIYTSGNNA